MAMRAATPEEAALRRTADVTRGRMHLVEHTWPANVRTPGEHRHTVHICFLAQGAIEERRGATRVSRVAPSVRVSPPGDAHACCYGNAGGQCLVIEPLAMHGDFDDVPAPHEPTIVQDERMVDLAARVYREMRTVSPQSVSGLVIESVALEVLAQSARWERPRAERRPPVWLTQLQECLRADLAIVPDLATLALMAGVHRVHVARAFREHLGCTVGDYVRRLRVRRACELLTATAVPLSDVAMRAGFFDQSHMTRVVKRFLGTTPAQLRETGSGRREAGGGRRQTADGRRQTTQTADGRQQTAEPSGRSSR